VCNQLKRLLAMSASIRLGLKLPTVTNALAYYDKNLIRAIKSLIKDLAYLRIICTVLRAFVTVSHFHPSLIFAGKAGAHSTLMVAPSLACKY
jgi:hypothetical protein